MREWSTPALTFLKHSSSHIFKTLKLSCQNPQTSLALVVVVQSSLSCSHHHRAAIDVEVVNPSTNVLSSLEGMNPSLAFSLGLCMNFVGASVSEDIEVWGAAKGALGVCGYGPGHNKGALGFGVGVHGYALAVSFFLITFLVASLLTDPSEGEFSLCLQII